MNDPSILNLGNTHSDNQNLELMSDGTRNPLSVDNNINAEERQTNMMNMQSEGEFQSPQHTTLNRDRIFSAKEYIQPAGQMMNQHKSLMMFQPQNSTLNNALSHNEMRSPGTINNESHAATNHMQREGMHSMLAGNMTIENNQPNQKGVIMQVNKYVPHYQRIPQKIEKKTFKMFDYSKDEEQSQDQFDKIKLFIEEFDKVLIDTMMIDRETKYNLMFRPDVVNNADLATGDDPTISPNENELTKKKVKQAEKALADYDSDEERENAAEMFVNDLQSIRRYFIMIISQQIKQQEEM